MAENVDSDTTSVGFKRRLSDLSENIDANHQHSNSVSSQPSSNESVSAVKEERETMKITFEPYNNSTLLLKKTKCSSSEETNDDGQEKQETVQEEKFGSGDDVVLEMHDGGSEGNEKDFGELKKGSTSSSGFYLEEVPLVSVGENWNKCLAGSATCFETVSSREILVNAVNGKGIFEHCSQIVEKLGPLGNKDTEVETISDAKTHDVKFSDMESYSKILGDTVKIDDAFDDSSLVRQKIGALESRGAEGKRSDCEEMQVDDGVSKYVLKIEVIDETALVGPVSVSQTGNGCGKENGFADFVKYPEWNGNKKDLKQETDGKKDKRHRRRGKGEKISSGINLKEKISTHMAEAEKVLIHMPEIQNFYESRVNEDKRVYSSKEMEALRFVNLEGQKKKWIEVYCGLGPAVAREYNGLVNSKNNQKHIQVNFDPRHPFGKEPAPILGEDCSQNVDNENMNPLDPTCDRCVSDVDGCTVEEGECSENDSDEYYSSIQKPAFLVKGDPDFDSGPPQDGLEYLRRVRWEAAKIPKVKVAKVDRSKLNKEQTVYMPRIPDIAKCPEHLLPLKQWEDAFLADFSELRLALSHHEESKARIPSNLLSISSVCEEECFHQPPESVILEKFDNYTTDGVDSVYKNSNKSQSFLAGDGSSGSFIPENSSPKSSVGRCFENGPTLSMILGMESLARVSMLRKRVNSVENLSTLSKSDCAWLFALCASVDTPLNADTCAAIRCLLRKCSSLRAEKSELDDEVIMLNILATISGRYFAQAEN